MDKMQCEPEGMLVPPEPEEEDQSTNRKTDEGSNVLRENGTIQENTTPKNEAISRYPRRDRKPPNYLSDFVTEGDEVDIVDTASWSVDYCCRVAYVPTTYAEAISSQESLKWKTAMKEDLDTLEENNTYQLQPIPENRSVISGKWVYTKKMDANNSIKYKARYVAKGFSQVRGIDFHETFSPTVKFTSVRMLMKVSVQENLLVHQMDVKTAYLNADINCVIFLEQPEGFVKTNSKGEKTCV